MFYENAMSKFLKIKNKSFLVIAFAVSAIYPLLIKEEVLRSRTLWLFFLLVIAKNHKYFKAFVIFSLLISGLYGVFGMSFGLPNLAIYESLIDTNFRESMEFMGEIPYKNWITVLVFFVLSYFYVKWMPRRKVVFGRNLFFYLVIFFAIFVNSWPFKLFNASFSLPAQYKKEKEFLMNSLNQQDTWAVTPIADAKKYENYVVVIGESMRKDYMSAYGYMHNTTPFLNQANGVFIDGALSVGPNTIASLQKTLQIAPNGIQGEVLPYNNAVTLAKKAGLETYWISNQGYMGEYDSSVSAVALRADHKVFFKKGEWSSANVDDEEVLTHFQKKLIENNPQKRRRIFFLHLMGSHPRACDRLHHFENNFKIGYGKQVDCYLASIAKTDDIIRRIVQLLSSKGSYSLIYFADHGLSVTEHHIKVDGELKNSYEVPLMMLSSDDVQRIFIKKRISQIHFLDLLSGWLGVNNNYSKKNYSFSSLERDEELDEGLVFDFKEVKSIDGLKEQQALK